MIKKCRIRLQRVTCLLILWVGIAVAGSPPLPFKAGSLQEILEAHSAEPFLLVLWSLRCVPCRHEMALLAETRVRHPDLEVVFVSTDGMAYADDVAAVLKDHGLQAAESWIFAGPVQRLRYAIDPDWYGVLPRSYFYNASHERVAVTGGLEKAQVLAWLQSLQP